MALNINGKIKVKTLQKTFKEEFGLTLRVYDGRSFADEDSTLASIRKGDSKGGEFAPKKNTTIGNLEDKIMDMFGIKTQVAGSDDSYLCKNGLTLKSALEEDEKKMLKKKNKATDKVETQENLESKENAPELSEATLLASEFTYYEEKVNIADVDTVEKLKTFLEEFIEMANSMSYACIIANEIETFDIEENGENIGYKINSTGSVFDTIDEDEILFIYSYTYKIADYHGMLNANEKVVFNTKKINGMEVVNSCGSITQNGNKLDMEPEDASGGSDISIGIMLGNGAKFLDYALAAMDKYELAGKIIELYKPTSKYDDYENEMKISLNSIDTYSLAEILNDTFDVDINELEYDLERDELVKWYKKPEVHKVIVDYLKNFIDKLIQKLNLPIEYPNLEEIIGDDFVVDQCASIIFSITLPKKLPQDILDAICLSLSGEFNNYFEAYFENDDYDTVKQGYEKGEYDTGWFEYECDDYIV